MARVHGSHNEAFFSKCVYSQRTNGICSLCGLSVDAITCSCFPFSQWQACGWITSPHLFTPGWWWWCVFRSHLRSLSLPTSLKLLFITSNKKWSLHIPLSALFYFQDLLSHPKIEPSATLECLKSLSSQEILGSSLVSFPRFSNLALGWRGWRKRKRRVINYTALFFEKPECPFLLSPLKRGPLSH